MYTLGSRRLDLAPFASRRNRSVDGDRDARLRARDVGATCAPRDGPTSRGATWLSIVYSSIFALGVAYTIWYAGVRQIGSARTSVYSNLIPIVAMATAVVFLGEPIRLAERPRRRRSAGRGGADADDRPGSAGRAV